MAYLITATVLLLVAAVHNTEGYWNYNTPREPPRCSSSNKPCRMSLSLANDFGVSTHISAAYLCSCNHPATCPEDWAQSDHVISRELISSSFRTTLNMMFCNPVHPDRVCQDGEMSVRLTGYLEIPNELEVYNCSCQDGVPLQLNRRWRDQNFRYKHEYVCGDQKPTCSLPVQPCVSIDPDASRYPCKCPGRSQCHLPRVPRRVVTSVMGYCGPPVPPNNMH